MASNTSQFLMLCLTILMIFTTMIIPTTQHLNNHTNHTHSPIINTHPLTTSQPCNSYTSPNNHHYKSCNNLPTLKSSLYWNYHPNTSTVDIAFKKGNAKDSSWIAWAINPTSKAMIGSQALVAFRTSNGTFKAYTSPITSYDTTLQQGNLSFLVYDVSGMYVNGSMIIFASFRLPRNASLVNHVWQEGLVSDDGSLRPHAFSGPNVQSFGTLDFVSEIISESDTRTTLRIVHGFLNAISWGILMPIGVILARYLKAFDGLGPIWFHMHRACQSLALLIGIIGFATGFYMGNHYGVHHTPHRCIGITQISLAFAQVCIAVCLRPKKDHKYRIFWNFFHCIIGYSTVVLAIWNIFKGFEILDARIIWKNIYVGIIVSLAVIVLMLEVITWMWFSKKRANKSKKSVNISQSLP